MTTPAALQRLLTWLSPAFPVGAFAWSAGLETAISDRRVTDSTALQNWIAGALHHGGLRTDAILLAQAWQVEASPHPSRPAAEPPSPARGEGDPTDASSPAAVPASASSLAGEGGAQRRVRGREDQLSDLADLSLALTPAAERHKETLLTGDAFVIAARAWPSEVYDRLPSPCPYPIAVGAIAAAQSLPLADTLLGYLTAAVHAQVSVAVRLVPLGQTDGLKVMAALEPVIADLAAAVAVAPLDDIGGIAYAADIAQMRHETLQPRIFRS